MVASLVIERLGIWSPSPRGYKALRDRSAIIVHKSSLQIVALLLLGFTIVHLCLQIPFFPARDRYSSCGSTESKRTTVLGGVPGYLTLENVWYRDKTFYMHNPNSTGLPKESELFSIPSRLELAVDVPAIHPDICFLGSTLMLNENWQAGWSGIWHYYHFATENIVSGIASLAISGFSGVPEQLLIPWEGGWHDRFGMNEMVVKGLWGADMDRVVSPERWEEFDGQGNAWIFFERISITDRMAAHRNSPLAESWNKMALAIVEADPPAGFFDPARNTLLRNYHIGPPLKGEPSVVYIDRQDTSRRLPSETHEALLEILNQAEKDGRVRFRRVVLDDLTKHEQIEAVAYADIMIGVHGNGLTHGIWMPRRSTLIELFTPTSFLRDYQSVAEELGQTYFAIQNDTQLIKSEWIKDPGEKNPNALHNGTLVELHMPLFREVFDEALGLYGAKGVD